MVVLIEAKARCKQEGKEVGLHLFKSLAPSIAQPNWCAAISLNIFSLEMLPYMMDVWLLQDIFMLPHWQNLWRGLPV